MIFECICTSCTLNVGKPIYPKAFIIFYGKTLQILQTI